MVAIELVKHEIKKHWVQLLIMVLFIAFLIPAQVWMEYLNLISIQDLPEDLKKIDFQHISSAFLLSVFVITLAIVQIGVERSNGNMEFNLALPFSRKSIYLTKWCVGAGGILFSWVLSYILTAVFIQFMDIPIIHFTEYYWYLLGTLLLFYTITFSAGAITGTPLAQGLVAFTICIFPILLFGLTALQYQILLNPYMDINESIEMGVYNVSPISYLFFTYGHYPIKNLMIPFVLAGIFLWVGFYVFVKHPFERNGSFFVWKWMEKPAQIIVIALGILGFSTFGYFSTPQNPTTGYTIGAAIGAGIGLLISYFAIYKKRN